MSFLAALRRLSNQFTTFGARFFPNLGLVLMAIAVVFALHSWLGTLHQIRAQATVTQNTSTQAPDGSVIYTSHLRFRLPDGKLADFTDPATSTDPDDLDFNTGTVVPVLYPAGHPGSARVATIFRLYRYAIYFGLLGIALFDAGKIFAVRLKNRLAGKPVKPWFPREWK